MNDVIETMVANYVKELHAIGFSSVDLNKPQTAYDVALKDGVADVFCIFDSNGKLIDDPRVVQIGHDLNNLGGLALMQKVYYEAIKPFKSSGPNLKCAWDKIGDWRY